jgi:hypothetical protein
MFGAYLSPNENQESDFGNFDGIDRLPIACQKFLQRWVIWVFFSASSRLLKKSVNIQGS